MENGMPAYRFTNRYDFTDLEELEIRYKIRTPSAVFLQGVLPVKCAPGETVSGTLAFTLPEFSFEEFFTEFSFHTKKDTVWQKRAMSLALPS